MKVFVNGELYDSEETAVVLIFANDRERNGVANQISNMPAKDGQRYYATYPAEKYTAAGIIQMMRELDK